MTRTTVEVEVELEDLNTEAMVKELRSRGADIVELSEESLEQIFAALKTGQDARALELTRSMLQDWKGCATL